MMRQGPIPPRSKMVHEIDLLAINPSSTDRRASVTNPIWTPSRERVARANMTRFIAQAGIGASANVHDYATLYAWSIVRPEEFWSAVWEFCGIVATRDADGAVWESVLIGGNRMAPPDPLRGPRWFDGARLNFAENLLRHRDDGLAIIAWNELGLQRRLTFAELYAEVAAVAAALRALGITAGDRVAGFVPSIPEAAIAMLAAASLGASWS